MKKVSNNPLVSVIVPVYNVERYLQKCIDSIVSQTYKNIEIILVDDGSTDNCPKICDDNVKKDKRIVVIHKKNGGLSDARNAGIGICKGDYISFIDSDDYVDNEYVELLVDNIVKNKADIAISSHKVVYPKKNIDVATYEVYVSEPKEILYRLLYSKGVDLSAWGKLYKKCLFDEISFPEGRYYEDAATTYRLIDKSKKISVVSKPTYNYIIRNSSISQKKFSKDKFDLIISTREMTEYVAKKYPDLQKACDRRMGYAYLSTLTQAIKSNKDDIAKNLMEEFKKYRKKLIRDRDAPKRDKIASIVSYAGLPIFKKTWSMYGKATGRE